MEACQFSRYCVRESWNAEHCVSKHSSRCSSKRASDRGKSAASEAQNAGSEARPKRDTCFKTWPAHKCRAPVSKCGVRSAESRNQPKPSKSVASKAQSVGPVRQWSEAQTNTKQQGASVLLLLICIRAGMVTTYIRGQMLQGCHPTIVFQGPRRACEAWRGPCKTRAAPVRRAAS